MRTSVPVGNAADVHERYAVIMNTIRLQEAVDGFVSRAQCWAQVPCIAHCCSGATAKPLAQGWSHGAFPVLSAWRHSLAGPSPGTTARLREMLGEAPAACCFCADA
eukprot:198672-Amphidinium_carterae.1